jgi:hypothetical protein
MFAWSFTIPGTFGIDPTGEVRPMGYELGSASGFDGAPLSRRRFQVSVATMMRATFIIGCLMGAGILGWRVLAPRSPRRPICVNHLKQIGLALHNYYSVYGVFPPAYVADESGKPMHSWRVLILPFLEEQIHRTFISPGPNPTTSMCAR